mmetsp:Transcript_24008/g.36904  ORF Transcript_24008/g.36904 Transcript_24008/m.36904 type:complete len:86 (-) Transcript_24008:24-281(-)
MKNDYNISISASGGQGKRASGTRDDYEDDDSDDDDDYGDESSAAPYDPNQVTMSYLMKKYNLGGGGLKDVDDTDEDDEDTEEAQT